MNNTEQNQIVLSVNQLSCRQSSQFQLRDISFDIPKGCCVGIIGPNGSGKTTLLKAITGFIPAKSGRFYYLAWMGFVNLPLIVVLELNFEFQTILFWRTFSFFFIL
jgi:ABC-type polysaccharide/polyol phosphate transport system ATPase subunit